MREQLSHVKSRFSDTEGERLEAVAAYQSLQTEVESAAELTEKLQRQLTEQTQLVQEIQQQCDRLQSQNRVSVLLFPFIFCIKEFFRHNTSKSMNI